MANLVTFAKKLWKDKVGGNTPITAAELNRIEGGVNDCANQINKLGDSVSLKVPNSAMSDGRLAFKWKFGSGIKTGLSIMIDGSEVAFIGAGTGLNS